MISRILDEIGIEIGGQVCWRNCFGDSRFKFTFRIRTYATSFPVPNCHPSRGSTGYRKFQHNCELSWASYQRVSVFHVMSWSLLRYQKILNSIASSSLKPLVLSRMKVCSVLRTLEPLSGFFIASHFIGYRVFFGNVSAYLFSCGYKRDDSALSET